MNTYRRCRFLPRAPSDIISYADSAYHRFILGHHDRIPAMAKEARGYLTVANDEVYLAKLAVSLGNAHFQRDAYGPALEEYDNALEIFQRMNVRDELVLSLGLNRAVGLSARLVAM